MAMIKTFSPYDWSSLVDGPVAVPLKVRNDNTIGTNDFRAFTKRAGDQAANVFANAISRIKFAKDVVPVHLIAVGASEAYGPNRNADAFPEGALKQAFDTFVKYGFWFRNHKNKKIKGDPHYGVIKAAAYNELMRRVELLIGLPATKAAADLLGCTDAATREVEKLARGDDLAVSMACRVPYDICSGCGNHAKTREDYCKEASCVYGGCTNNLMKLVKVANDTHLLHVVNDQPVFFDISDVFKPADRIAYARQADWIKSASDAFTKDAELVQMEKLAAPLDVILAQDVNVANEPDVAAQVKLAYGMARLEDQVPDRSILRVFTTQRPPLDFAALGVDTGDSEKIAASLAAMAARKIVMPLTEFARMTKRAELCNGAAAVARTVFSRMLDDGDLADRLRANKYKPGEKQAELSVRLAAAKAAPDYAIGREATVARSYRTALPSTVYNSAIEKSAGSVGNAEVQLAKDYGCYMLATMQRIADDDTDFNTTARFGMYQLLAI